MRSVAVSVLAMSMIATLAEQPPPGRPRGPGLPSVPAPDQGPQRGNWPGFRGPDPNGRVPNGGDPWQMDRKTRRAVQGPTARQGPQLADRLVTAYS